MQFIQTIFKRLVYITGAVILCLSIFVSYVIVQTAIDEAQYVVAETASASEVYMDDDVLVVRGKIDEHTPILVKSIFQFNIPKTNITTLSITSNGGSANAGLQLAQFVEDYQLDTFAPAGCYSACTLVFVAGDTKTITLGTEMGFHSPGWDFEEETYSSEMTGSFVSTVNEYSGRMMKRYIDSGLSTTFVAKVMATPFNDMGYYNATELLENGIANNLL